MTTQTAPALSERPLSKTQLFCSNLPWSVNGKILRLAFEAHGTVTDAFVAYNGRSSRGFGYVTFQDPVAAAAAVKAMNGTALGSEDLVPGAPPGPASGPPPGESGGEAERSREIRVEMARERPGPRPEPRERGAGERRGGERGERPERDDGRRGGERGDRGERSGEARGEQRGERGGRGG
eukprot:CAMPEP_0183334136 /NCGR_PEP_ID=MMETSP0164_2-20130417/2829_1 /TAXON_ID=221442 /ORGANISM="Coccolithus pelagicus ssp braarudi, Strain PLY182g" /LENGTH=179 /DNA_ID=CAMNT_0025503219 /DNA_START=155 /DNA_END=691 /DNA_ORIENTATION=-